MNIVLPESLLQILSVSMIFSVVLMSLIQKLKALSIVNKTWHIWILNLIFSFGLGIPFGMLFYQLSVEESTWVGVFSFIGAASIYDALKNYKPTSLSHLENEIASQAVEEITKNPNSD